MDRLTKKCLISSAALHGSLCGVVLICSAFMTKETPAATVMEIFPYGGKFEVTNGESHGGGAAPAKPAQKVEPTPPTPPPPTVQRHEVADPEPVKPTPRQTAKPQPVKDEPALKDRGEIAQPKTTHQVKVSLDQVVRPNSKKSHSKKADQRDTEQQDGVAESNARNKRREQLANSIMSMAGSIARTTAQSVVTDSIGNGSGGIASVNYRTAVFMAFYNAWDAPDEIDDREATVVAEITVSRDGRIISKSVERRSGKPALDRSVEAALRRVSTLPAFPPGSSESQRTFELKFNLKSKIGLG